jgi:hypothetical protein
MRTTIFKIVILLTGLSKLMICTQDLIILTKTKETTCYCKSFGLRRQNALDNRFYRYNASQCTCRKRINQSSTFTHSLNGPTLTCPLMPIVDEHFRAHSSPISNSQTTKIFINNKEAFISLIVLLKPQMTKEGHQQENKLNTLKIHNIPSSTQFHSCNITHVSLPP